MQLRCISDISNVIFFNTILFLCFKLTRSSIGFKDFFVLMSIIIVIVRCIS